MPTISWSLWNARNQAIFRAIDPNPSLIIANVLFFVKLWAGTANSKKHKQTHKAIQVMGFPGLYQGSIDSDEPDSITGANSV